MSSILASCKSCGDLKLDIPDVVLVECVDTATFSYRFTCPVCDTIVLKDTNEATASRLEDAGVVTHEWRLPSDTVIEPSAADLTHDDLLEFHEQMKVEGVLAEACAKLTGN